MKKKKYISPVTLLFGIELKTILCTSERYMNSGSGSGDAPDDADASEFHINLWEED